MTSCIQVQELLCTCLMRQMVCFTEPSVKSSLKTVLNLGDTFKIDLHGDWMNRMSINIRHMALHWNLIAPTLNVITVPLPAKAVVRELLSVTTMLAAPCVTSFLSSLQFRPRARSPCPGRGWRTSCWWKASEHPSCSLEPRMCPLCSMSQQSAPLVFY